MGMLELLFIWPFLILAFGLVFIALFDLGIGGGLSFLVIALLFVLAFLQREKNKQAVPQTMQQQVEALRRVLVTASIALLMPIFVRYLFEAFQHNLAVIIVGLAFGFGLATWGMFLKSNKVLLYSNIIGGALTIIYVYSKLWELGGLARIIAAAFGLIIAVVISTIKLREKLT